MSQALPVLSALGLFAEKGNNIPFVSGKRTRRPGFRNGNNAPQSRPSAGLLSTRAPRSLSELCGDTVPDPVTPGASSGVCRLASPFRPVSLSIRTSQLRSRIALGGQQKASLGVARRGATWFRLLLCGPRVEAGAVLSVVSRPLGSAMKTGQGPSRAGRRSR